MFRNLDNCRILRIYSFFLIIVCFYLFCGIIIIIIFVLELGSLAFAFRVLPLENDRSSQRSINRQDIIPKISSFSWHTTLTAGRREGPDNNYNNNDDHRQNRMARKKSKILKLIYPYV